MGAFCSVRKQSVSVRPSKSEAETIGHVYDASLATKCMDLSSKSYTCMPSPVVKSQHVNILIMNDNKLQTVDPQIQNLFLLQDLQLKSNQLTSLPAELGSLSKLSSLNVESNRLSVLPLDLFSATAMEELNISINIIRDLPTTIGNLLSLCTLNVANNRLSTLPREISCLTRLVDFRAGHNYISSIPWEIGNLTNLEIVDLSSNKLSYLPSHIWNCISLERLVLRYNQLTQLPMASKDLPKLRELNLMRNELTNVGDVTHFPQLNRLLLSRNQLSYLPESLSTLSKLVILWLEENPLQRIPSFLFSIPLSVLQVSQHTEAEFPQEFSLATTLSIAQFTSGSLEKLPGYMCAPMNKLHKLNFTGNKISSLPTDFGGLSMLMELRLGDNRISHLPSSITALEHLQNLFLHFNSISEIPSSISGLSKLKKLSLSNNSISSLPDSFGKLSSLVELHISFNPISSLSESLLSLRQLKSLFMSSLQFPDYSFLEVVSQFTWLTTVDLSRNGIKAIPDSFWAKPNCLLHVDLSCNNISALPQAIMVNQKIISFDLSGNMIPPDAWASSDRIVSSINEIALQNQLQLEQIPDPLNIQAHYISWMGRRKYMEDYVKITSLLSGKYYLFCVFDGHDGIDTAAYLYNRFHVVLEELLADLEPRIALQNAYATLDAEILAKIQNTSGSTALTILIGEDTIYTANAGDSRAVIYRENGPSRISFDHKPFVAAEYERIRELSGVVTDDGRVSGILSMSRAMGDNHLKPFVSAEPFIQRLPRTKLDKWLVIASDGLWDVASDAKAGDILMTCGSPRVAAYTLKEFSFLNESMDNTSIIVVKLDGDCQPIDTFPSFAIP
eukprot:TRINITY_DN3014_c0_g1_i1.p1 TRINITY_DN3014_c0_g1~~TRINITY_DN3014_c0_g1_i1.p1  ORF type:complete len:843 (-),score=178.01 TRINITY_DN3014_c0_g1_i1:651-3179(-)